MITVELLDDIQQRAASLFASQPDWATFYREILGPQGIAHQHFPTRDAQAAFEQTPVAEEIRRQLARLRTRSATPLQQADTPPEPTRIVTVRLPQSLHKALRLEAYEHNTSMNKLCISKLLQFIDDTMVPDDLTSAE